MTMIGSKSVNNARRTSVLNFIVNSVRLVNDLVLGKLFHRDIDPRT